MKARRSTSPAMPRETSSAVTGCRSHVMKARRPAAVGAKYRVGRADRPGSSRRSIQPRASSRRSAG